jgi:hypothetical protein
MKEYTMRVEMEASWTRKMCCNDDRNNSISWTKKLRLRYNYTGLLLMMYATAPLKETLCILFGRAKWLKVGHY